MNTKHLPVIVLNLRYFLWREHISGAKWAGTLGQWLGCDTNRAVALLQGKDQLTAEEMAKLARQTGIIGEQLCNDELVRQTDILRENLNYLLSAPGEKGRLAAFAGVHQNAVTRWLAGIQPNAAHKRRIQAFFGLPAEVDLAQEPLFLSLSPVTARQQKEWLHQQIDELDPEILRALFPALAKLLR